MIANRLWHALVIGGVLVAMPLAALNAANGNLRARAPDSALKLRPGDGVALAIVNDRSIASAQGRSQAIQAVAEPARLALRDEPLNAAALRQLGLVAEVDKKPDQALTLMNVAERVSRRDFGTQLWMIEHESAAGNVAGTLAHYNTALSTNAQAEELLFPVLTGALSDAGIRRAFVHYVQTDRPWLRDFLRYAIVHGGQPKALAQTLILARRLPDHVDFRILATQLLWRLAAIGDNATLVSYFLAQPGASRPFLGNASMNAVTSNTAFGPVAWHFANLSNVGANLQGDALWIRAAAGEQGIVAQRRFFLSPGKYRLSYSVALDTGPAADLVWELRCIQGSSWQSGWRQPVDRVSGPRNDRFEFNVAANCLAQDLTLFAIGGDEQQDSQAIVSKLSIVSATSSSGSQAVSRPAK